MKHATYQIVLPIVYLYCFNGQFRVRVSRGGERIHRKTELWVQLQEKTERDTTDSNTVLVSREYKPNVLGSHNTYNTYIHNETRQSGGSEWYKYDGEQLGVWWGAGVWS